MEKRLTRIKEGQMIGGVATGLAHYFDVDVSVVRIIFMLLTLGQGAGLLIYFVLWLVMPQADQGEETTWQENVRVGAGEIRDRAQEFGDELGRAAGQHNEKTLLIAGGALVVIGLLLVLRNFVPWLGWGTLWPVALIALGVTLLLRR